MAAPDHTVLIRPFFAMDGAFSSLPSCSRVAAARESTSRPLTPRDGITEVEDSLASLLADSEAHRHAPYLKWPSEPRPWPFAAVYADGIGAAIHYLQPSAGVLGRVPK